MSDEDDSDDYEFEYSDEEVEEEADEQAASTENSYYNAKMVRDDGKLEEAADLFLEIVSNEEDNKTAWGFKSLKQLIKLYSRMEKKTEMIKEYVKLLGYIVEGAVTQNVSEKGIKSILERESTTGDNGTLHKIYSETLKVFKAGGGTANERLWFKTNLKLGQLLLDMSALDKLETTISELLAAPAGKQGAHMLEIYCLQIQLYSQRRDNKKLKELYNKAMAVKDNVPHPKTLALIYECGGKMHMSDREFEEANTAFFCAFKSFDEAGDMNRLRALKYTVLATMLCASEISPFDSQEARPYKDDPEIKVMTNLVAAFQNNEIKKFESILKRREGLVLLGDPFIKSHVDDLLRSIRTQVLLKVIIPYTRCSLKFLGRELNGVEVQQVENLLVSLILEGKINGKIDQVKGELVIENKNEDDNSTAENENLQAMRALTNKLESLSSSFANNIAKPHDNYAPVSVGGGLGMLGVW